VDDGTSLYSGHGVPSVRVDIEILGMFQITKLI